LGKTEVEALIKAVGKYSVKQINEAFIALREWHEQEIASERDLFSIAVSLKRAE
jgi:hypothetical protein